MKQNLYKILFYKNDEKTVTMEKFADSQEEAISKCLEKLQILNLSDLYDRYEVQELPVRNEWS